MTVVPMSVFYLVVVMGNYHYASLPVTLGAFNSRDHCEAAKHSVESTMLNQMSNIKGGHRGGAYCIQMDGVIR